MTKDMETPAGLLIAADAHATAYDYLWGPRHIASKDGFLAGAEWQKAQFDADRETHLLVRDHNTIIAQADQIAAYAMTIKDMKGKLAEFDLMRKDRDDWHHAYDKLVSDVVHGRRIDDVNVLSGDNGEMPNPVRDLGDYDASPKAADGFVPLPEGDRRDDTDLLLKQIEDGALIPGVYYVPCMIMFGDWFKGKGR